MKKTLVLFGILSMVPMASFAYINEGQTANIDNLRTQGYCENTLKVLDQVTYQQQNGGSNGQYQKYYAPRKSNFLGKAYYNLKRYFDPAQEDDQFMMHDIEFSNTWEGDDTFYSSKTVPVKNIRAKNAKKQVQNL